MSDPIIDAIRTRTLLGGPALGGLLYTAVGLRLSVSLDIVSYLISAATLTALHAPALQAQAAPTTATGLRRMLTDLTGAVRLARRNPTLRALLAVTVVMFTAGGLIGVLIVPFARGPLHASGTDYGLVISAQAIGGLLGATIAARVLRPFPTARTPMAVCLALTALAVAALSTTTRWEAAAACLIVGGAPTTITGVVANTVLQTAPDQHHRGRMTGLYSSTTAIGALIGAPCAGLLVTLYGTAPSMKICAGMFAASSILALATFPKHASLQPPPADSKSR